MPGKVNFSCRIPRCARARDLPVDIIASLKAYASIIRPKTEVEGGAESPGGDNAPLLERLGDDFARGHVQASGGIVDAAEFEELMENMQIGVKPPQKEGEEGSPNKKKKSAIDTGQKNNLMNYFGKATKAETKA